MMLKFALSLAKKAIHTPLPELHERVARAMKVYVFKYPTIIVLQTASACNLKCEHCFINNYGCEITDGVKKIMTMEEFETFVTPLIPAIKQADYFQFTTFEPFLQKNLFQMMDRVLEINPKVKFPILTNVQLTDDSTLEKLKNYPISEFTVSLDGMHRETVESFKTGTKFDKIVEVMKKFTELNFSVPLQCVFVMQKNNYRELPEYMDFVNKLGCKRVYVNNLLSFTEKHKDITLYSSEYQSELQSIFAQTIQKAETNGQELFLPGTMPEQQGCKTCEMLFVDINGNIAPCDFLAVSTPFYFQDTAFKASPVVFGNIFKTKPLDIFRSKAYNDFRNLHRDGSLLPKDCEYCINAYGLMCSNRNKFGKIRMDQGE